MLLRSSSSRKFALWPNNLKPVLKTVAEEEGRREWILFSTCHFGTLHNIWILSESSTLDVFIQVPKGLLSLTTFIERWENGHVNFDSITIEPASLGLRTIFQNPLMWLWTGKLTPCELKVFTEKWKDRIRFWFPSVSHEKTWDLCGERFILLFRNTVF